MTRAEYVSHLTALHRQANKSDQRDMREDWQKATDCNVHCVAIEGIARDLLSPAEYQAWLDNL